MMSLRRKIPSDEGNLEHLPGQREPSDATPCPALRITSVAMQRLVSSPDLVNVYTISDI